MMPADTTAPELAALLTGLRAESGHRPWPRFEVDQHSWLAAADLLATGKAVMLGLWGDSPHVHMALMENNQVAVLSLYADNGAFPSIGARHAPAIRLERAIRDLFGLHPTGAADQRAWLDHGRWYDKAPAEAIYPFLSVDGDGLHQVPVGPVHAGIIEPGHFRFTCNGETVVRLEERLGYVHKGIEGLMAGSEIARCARLAARASGDSTVAYGYAFARAVEAALEMDVPLRAVWLRAVMAEMERLANHLGDVGAICNDAAFSLALTHFALLREKVLRTASQCFGHRLMMDCIVPGGLIPDVDADGIALIQTMVEAIESAIPRLRHLYDETPSLQDRTTGTGRVGPQLVAQFAAGGFVGRASGREFDVRRSLAYPPYDSVTFEAALRQEGDVNARVWIRLDEIGTSLQIIRNLLQELPSGPVRTTVPAGSGEGMAFVEGFRGDILAWVALDGGVVRRCHLRDPSWFQWPLLEAAIDGNILADFPLCNKSFNCSYSGHDL